jgi:photosystem II stability/assembly factor-like uncharacterized protein
MRIGGIRMRTMELLACARTLLFVALGCGTLAASAEDRDAPISYSARVINPKLTGSLFATKSRTVLLWGTDGTIVYSTDANRWHYADTPADADLARVAADATGKVLIAVGERGTILRSEDAGRRWQAVSLAASDFDLRAVIHHASSGAWIAAGTRGTILRSLDGGKTWNSLPNELNLTLATLFIEPDSGALLIGGESGLIGRSTDAGASWLMTRVKMQEPVTPVTAIHLLGNELVATSALGRFLISTDRGESWQLLSMGGNAYFTDAVLEPKSHALLLASHTGDLFRRGRPDDSWEKIELLIDGQKRFISAIRYDANTESLLAVGHHGLAARSTDGGRQWHKIATGFNSSMESLAQFGDGRFVGFGEGGYIVTSADSGKSWRRVSPELSLGLREVVALPGSDVVVASGELGGILRSADSGQTWTSIDVTYPNMNTPPNLRSLMIEPSGKALIAAGAPGTIIRSEDGGTQWRIAHWTPLEKEEAFPWILSDPRQQSLAVIEARGSNYWSQDAGRTWQLSKLSTDRELWQGMVAANKSTLLAAGQRGVAARSTDGGRSWRLVETGADEDLFGSYADERSGAMFLLGGKGTLLRSTDAGQKWRRIPSGTERSLRRMLHDPKSNTLVAFGEYGSLVRSVDDGESWHPVGSNTEVELRKGLTEPDSGALIIIGQQGLILRSVDAGKTWQRIPSHTRRHFRSAVFNSRNGDLILVGERIVRLSRTTATSH